MRCAIVVLAALVLIGCSKKSEDVLRSTARNYVVGRMKAPSTAQISNIHLVHETKVAEDYWSASGFVDAENSFGARLRTDFKIGLMLTKSGTVLVVVAEFQQH